MQASSPEPNVPPRPRWRLLIGFILLGALVLGVIWLAPQASRQHRILRTLITTLVLLLGSLVWLMVLSRLAWRARWRGLLGVVLVIGGLLLCFRNRGFTGDMLPIYEWRWAKHQLAEPQAKNPTPVPEAALPGEVDYPQFLGPERQAYVPDQALARDWQKQPPETLWRQPVGTGWSGFAIAGRRAVTQEQRGDQECVVCYDLLTGSVLWEQRSMARFFADPAGEGPRATPTLEGNRCYTQGAMGRLQCLDLATGNVLWSADTVAAGRIEGTAKVQQWGMSSSPCISGNMLLTAGPEVDEHASAASVVAFDKGTGKVLWKAGTSGGAFSSPLVAEFGGLRQVVYFGPDAIAGYAATDGKSLWSYSWPRTHPHVCMPLLLGGDDLLVSSGYGTGSARLHIAKGPAGAWASGEVWRTNKMKAKFTNLVRIGDFVYGLDDGVLACLDARDGGLKWKDGKYRHGQVILVGALLLLTSEEGEAVLLDPQPDARHELTRFQAINGKTWNPPALAGRYLLVRNDAEAACYRLPVIAK